MQLHLTFEGLDEQIDLIRLQQRFYKDQGPSLQRAAYPWLLAHLKRQVATSGAHGGTPWTFGGEAKYAKAKAARYGKRYGSRPLALPPRRGVLLPSLMERSHHMHVFRRGETEIEIGSSAPHAHRLLYLGGTGPYGERYPARSPFEMTAGQRAELDKAVVDHIEQRVKSAWIRRSRA
jgi:hypothetical protein